MKPSLHNALRAIGAAGLALLVLLLAGAAILPRLLDWSRYRDPIAVVAGAELGRPVLIRGRVRLTLLPHAVITASDIVLPDLGDGVGGSIGALRLEVGLLPLLAGRIVPRDLTLSSPHISLPWRAAGAAGAALKPLLPHGFAARIEDGALQLGRARLAGVGGSITVDGAGRTEVAGNASWLERPWAVHAIFQPARPGSPEPAAFSLDITGQGPALHTRAQISAAISSTAGTNIAGTNNAGMGSGAVAASGEVSAAGPDTALLLGPLAPHQGFALSGHWDAGAARIAAARIDLRLGESTFLLAGSLGIAEPGLELQLTSERADLRRWGDGLRLLAGGLAEGAGDLRLNADVTRLLLAEGELSAARLSLTRHAGLLDLAGSATFPSGAAWAMSGRSLPGAPATIAGSAHGQSPDVLADLRLLAAAAGLAGRLPHQVLPANLTLPWRWAAAAAPKTATNTPNGELRIDGLSGDVGGSKLTGQAVLTPGARPKLMIDAALDKLPQAALIRAARALPGLLRGTAGSDATAAPATPDPGLDLVLALRATLAEEPCCGAGEAMLRLHAGADGWAIDDAHGRLARTDWAATGKLGADGTLRGARLDARSLDASAWPALLPRLHGLAGLFSGRMGAVITAAGPAEALHSEARLDLDDLRIEAQSDADLRAGRVQSILTARHPGVPRLLAALGLPAPQAQAWLGSGSLAIWAHAALSADAGMTISAFNLTAGALLAEGSFAANGASGLPQLRLSSASIPLPELPVIAALLRPAPELSLQGDNLTLLRRDQVWAQNAALELTASGGAAAVNLRRADALGGKLVGEAAMDGTAAPPRLALRGGLIGAALPPRPLGWKLDVSAARLGVVADLAGTAASPAGLRNSLAGEVRVTLADATLSGIDLARAARTLADPPGQARRNLTAALSGGATKAVSADATFTLAAGKAALNGRLDTAPDTARAGPAPAAKPAGAPQAADDGSGAASGMGGAILGGQIDLARGTVALSLDLVAPQASLVLSGPLAGPDRRLQLPAAAKPARVGKKAPPRPARPRHPGI